MCQVEGEERGWQGAAELGEPRPREIGHQGIASNQRAALPLRLPGLGASLRPRPQATPPHISAWPTGLPRLSRPLYAGPHRK